MAMWTAFYYKDTGEINSAVIHSAGYVCKPSNVCTIGGIEDNAQWTFEDVDDYDIAWSVGGENGVYIGNIDNYPPTLILHGEDDPLYPVIHAQRFHDHLADKEITTLIEIEEDFGHTWIGTDNVDWLIRVWLWFAQD